MSRVHVGITRAELEMWYTITACHADFQTYTEQTRRRIALLGAWFQTCFANTPLPVVLGVLVKLNRVLPFGEVLIDGTAVTITATPPCIHLLPPCGVTQRFDCVNCELITDQMPKPTVACSVELHDSLQVITRDMPWST